MESLGSDYNHYSVRIIHQGKLHCVDSDGAATEPSKEQDWKINEDYYNARYVDDLDCEIEMCDCSYPIFWSHKSFTDLNGEAVTDWCSITCLIDDHGRDINCCPNCGAEFFEQEDGEEEDEKYSSAPDTCIGCKYYSDNYVMACAVHPYGPDDDICPDYSM
jgi:hypothetical protein